MIYFHFCYHSIFKQYQNGKTVQLIQGKWQYKDYIQESIKLDIELLICLIPQFEDMGIYKKIVLKYPFAYKKS